MLCRKYTTLSSRAQLSKRRAKLEWCLVEHEQVGLTNNNRQFADANNHNIIL